MPLMVAYRRQRGFSLIELLVVVAIISILAAVGFPIYSGYIATAADTDAKTTLRMISASQERYKMLNGVYYATSVSQPSATTTIEIQNNLLSNLSINTNYYTYAIQTSGCSPQPNTGVARQFCAYAQKTGDVTKFTIDHTDAIYDQNNKLQ